jgi:hypothetical protein
LKRGTNFDVDLNINLNTILEHKWLIIKKQERKHAIFLKKVSDPYFRNFCFKIERPKSTKEVLYSQYSPWLKLPEQPGAHLLSETLLYLVLLKGCPRKKTSRQ